LDGLFFVFAILATVLAIDWAIRNDKVPPTGKTHGLFALPDRNVPDPVTRPPQDGQIGQRPPTMRSGRSGHNQSGGKSRR
jgi:hypothetical protein